MADPADRPWPLLLYDGSCGLCDSTLQLILRRDRTGTLRFAALESDRGRAIRAEHPELHDVDSVVWVAPAGTDEAAQVFVRSAAALRVARYLGGVWSLALVAYVVPRFIRDVMYDFIARHRHPITRGSKRCVIPPPEARHRFVE